MDFKLFNLHSAGTAFHDSASAIHAKIYEICIVMLDYSMGKDNNDIRIGRHCVFMMLVHLVFVTKYRSGVFTKDILDDLRPIFAR